MRSAAAAFGWEFGRRHRWGWLALATWLAALLVVRLTGPASGRAIGAEWGAGFAFAVVVPGSTALFWLIAIFSYGSSGSVTGRQSMYPERLFTLPVPTSTLTIWPMLYGATAVTLTWLATRALAPWPADLPFTMPVLWPGLLAIALVAWTQALMWTSYPLRGLRVAVAVLWLGVVEAVAILAIEFRVAEWGMVALLAPQLPLAYVVARRAVARARRGDVAGWRGRVAPLRRLDGRAAAGGPTFASAHAAQRWLEWQRYGRALPVMVAMVLPVELSLLWTARGTPGLVFTLLAIVAVTPPFLAAFTALAVRKSGAGSDYAVSPFTATRPVSSAALVGARLGMAARSTGTAWLVVLAAAPLALAASGTWGLVAGRVQRFAAGVGTDRAIVCGALVLAMLLLTTWRQMVQSLYLGLTGREGLVKGSAFGMLCLIVAIGPVLDWAWTSGARAWLWVGLYWTLGVAVTVRTVLACAIATCLHRDRLIRERTLVAGAVLWLAAVAGVYAVLVWWFSTPYAPRFLLLMMAVLSVPLVRLSAAPLALAWNRHR